jgi:hypothetical protein
MKRPYGLLLTLLVLSGPALTGCTRADAATVSVPAPADPAQGNVAVLVVDDFGLGRDPQVKLGTKHDNCTVGTNDVGSNGAGDDLPASAYAHGELAYRVLKDELTSDLGTAPVASTTTPPPGGGPPIETMTDWSYPINGRPYIVRLVAVHTDRYRTDDILAGIRDRITTLRRARFNRFVLNMSFVVVPCDVVGWLTDPDLDGLLKTYDAMIQNDSTSTLKAGLASFLTDDTLDIGKVRAGTFTETVLRDDTLAALRPYLVGAFYKEIDTTKFNTEQRPLSTVYNDAGWRSFRTQLIEPGASGSRLKIIPVGAAGNGVKYPDPRIPDPVRANDPANLIRKGLPFPFAPALWDFVVSASADADADVVARLNSGEVKLDGTGPAIVPGSFGTSFAAPRLSALEAKYLAETGNVVCGGTPPLGYIDMTAGSMGDVSGSSPWRNRGKADWPSICGDFPS